MSRFNLSSASYHSLWMLPLLFLLKHQSSGIKDPSPASEASFLVMIPAATQFINSSLFLKCKDKLGFQSIFGEVQLSS